MDGTPEQRPGAGRVNLLPQAFLLAASAVLLYVIAGPRENAWAPAQDDQLLVADFVDSTGEGNLAPGLRQMLIIALDQSPRFRIFPESRLRRIVKEMRVDPVEGVTPEIAAAVCRREGIPFFLLPSLSRTGDAYLMKTRLVQVRDGHLRREYIDTVRADTKIDLICDLNQLEAKVRSFMGESAHSIGTTGLTVAHSAALDAEALTLLTQALALGARENYEGELSILQHAVTLNPRLALAQLTLGELFLRLGRKQDAARPVSLAVQEAESLPFKERNHALALSLVLRQEYGRAREQYRALADRYPWDPEIQIQLAETSARICDFARARESYEKALHLDDTRIAAYVGLCMAHLYDGNVEAAQKAWQGADALDPADADVVATGGLMDLVNNDLGSALRSFGRLSESPSACSRSKGMLLIAEAQVYGGRFQAALATLARGIESDDAGNDTASAANKRLCRAGVYLLLGDHVKAAEECGHVTRLSRAEDIGRLGVIFARTGRIEQARDQVRRIENLPDSPWARYHAAVLRGEIELASGRPASAVSVLRDARGLYPDCRPLEPLARSLAEAQRYNEAEEEYRLVYQMKALTLFPPAGGWFMGTWPEALVETARCLDRLGKAEDALQYYRNYLWVLESADPGLANVLQAREELRKGSSRTGLRRPGVGDRRPVPGNPRAHPSRD